jgi:hypothetical protein
MIEISVFFDKLDDFSVNAICFFDKKVPDLFLILPFVGGLPQCRGWVCQP